MEALTEDEKHAQVLIAQRQLEDAIYALTCNLEYEWEDEWRPGIEALNKAHIRWLAAKQRAKR